MSEITFDDNQSYFTEETVEDKAIETENYAGFWMRFWAYLTDVLIVMSLNSILLSPLNLLNEGSKITVSYWTLNGILAAVIFYLYFVIMTKFFSQTIGKILFHIKVVRLDGKPLQWSDLLFREVIGRFIHRAFSLCFLLYAVVGFHKKKQGIHDIFAETTVVHKSRETK